MLGTALMRVVANIEQALELWQEKINPLQKQYNMPALLWTGYG